MKWDKKGERGEHLFLYHETSVSKIFVFCRFKIFFQFDSLGHKLLFLCKNLSKFLNLQNTYTPKNREVW